MSNNQGLNEVKEVMTQNEKSIPVFFDHSGKLNNKKVSKNTRWQTSAIRLIFLVIIVWSLLEYFIFHDSISLIEKNIIIIPIAFLAAAFANATAVGGGFLFVPIFILGYGLAPISALKLSIATQAFGMTSGTLGWSRKCIVLKSLLIAGIASILGMYVGTYYILISNTLVKQLFGWVSVTIFILIMLEIKYGQVNHNDDIVDNNIVKFVFFVVLSFIGGIVTATTAIGIGEIVTLYLMFIYRVRIEAAIGTGVAALALDSIAGFIIHIHLGGINWEYLTFTVPGVIAGGFFGAKIGGIIESKTREKLSKSTDSINLNHSPLKWLFASIVLVDGITILIQSH